MERKNLDQQTRMRLRWITHYQEVTHNVSQTCRYLGVSRSTFYVWYHRYLSFGVAGLQTKSSRPHKICYKIPKDIVEKVIELRFKENMGQNECPIISKKNITGIYQK